MNSIIEDGHSRLTVTILTVYTDFKLKVILKLSQIKNLI